MLLLLSLLKLLLLFPAEHICVGKFARKPGNAGKGGRQTVKKITVPGAFPSPQLCCWGVVVKGGDEDELLVVHAAAVILFCY